ncbi:MAG: outer membrane beta-barrel protein [Steroidobacteraceae bacterium]
MVKPFARGVLLAAVAFAVKAALAQTPAATQSPPRADEEVDVATPGGLLMLDEALIEGQREVDIQQATTQVVSVLSSEDIARTGEGDVAGALSHVPGLSVVGGGFVYVRGLGDRYSLALLNGSPLPSPEPLRRAVPLDLFPTDVIASSLVQKTYSPNYTGEFGGGVINLTTLAIPRQPFLKFGVGVGANTATTGGTGYDYYGSKRDWTGYDGGARYVPPTLAAFFASGQRISAIASTDAAGHNPTSDIAKEFVGPKNGIVQQIDEMPANFSGSLTGGTAWQVGEGAQLGVIATAGYSNNWRTRDNIEQQPGSLDLSTADRDFRTVSSENHIVSNGLLGISYESGENRLRWTNFYVHDTLKRTSISTGTRNVSRPDADFAEQGTGWYERQLLTTQLTGTLQLDPITISARTSYSTSRREAPYELNVGYSRSNVAASPYGAYFVNRLDNGSTGFAKVAFSDLDEDLVSGGLDVAWRLAAGTVVSLGYDYAYTARESERREFQVIAPSSMPTAIGLLRPDLLLAPAIIEYYDIGLVETTESDPAFAARLLTHGGYLQLQTQLGQALDLSVGARYEDGKEVVRPEQKFSVLTNSGASARLENDYILPAATLTWKLGSSQDQQLRFNVSKTIARPQFRELMFQLYYDPEANRAYRGNPLLSDSKFVNAEARYEWYFAPEQRLSVAGFYKKIDKPIEGFVSFGESTPIVSFANAPEAQLYGLELETQKYFLLDGFGGRDDGLLNSFLAQRRLVTSFNYTYTQSKIKVGADDTVQLYGSTVTTYPATIVFEDGAQLTGQSDHLVNVSLGLERPDKLSQITVLASYASDRVTSRGGGGGMPDIYESPGVNLDLVVRQGVDLFGQALELKFEARNLTGHGYREFQEKGGNTIYYNKYDVGRSFSASVSLNF